MTEQRVGRLYDAPDTGLLVNVQLNGRPRARQRQVFAVERANSRMIDGVVVEAAEAFPTFVIRPDPFRKPLFDALLLLAGGLGGRGVDHRFFVRITINRRCSEIQRFLNPRL